MGSLDDSPFTNFIRQKILRGWIRNFENLCHSFMPDLRVGDTNAQLEKLNVMGLIGPPEQQGPGGSWIAKGKENIFT